MQDNVEAAQAGVLSNQDYRSRVTACWLGKAVGGTLGMPFEGVDGPLDLNFYTPVPAGMLPNDDLDLQVVWACVLDRMETPEVDRHILGQAWLDHVDFPWDEYGVAIRNLKNGLHPPLTGSFDNWFMNAMGAPIRSEIWACLAPGNPNLAAAYAYEDACVDHADEGIWSEVFLAALESAAFIESDPRILLRQALSLLPLDSVTRCAVEETIRLWVELGDWRTVRSSILETYGHENFTDAPMNMAFTVLGWLAGDGDFSKAICVAANCGKDTDCTAATVGALMGILDPDCIPEEWLSPIGRSLVISPGINGINAPATLDEFTDLVARLRGRLNGRKPRPKFYEAQDFAALAIHADVAFVNAMPGAMNPPDFKDQISVNFAGTVGKVAIEQFEDEILLVKYRFTVPKSGTVRIMFNTRVESRVWVDGAFAFGRNGGAMAPSLHRAPEGQMTIVDMTAGRHELIAALRRPANSEEVEWVVGVGDGDTAQWFPKAFAVQACANDLDEIVLTQ